MDCLSAGGIVLFFGGKRFDGVARESVFVVTVSYSSVFVVLRVLGEVFDLFGYGKLNIIDVFSILLCL